MENLSARSEVVEGAKCAQSVEGREVESLEGRG